MSCQLSIEQYRDAATRTGLFSAEFYLSALLSSGIVCPPAGQSLFEHFATIGWTVGLSPSAKFNLDSYLSGHPELQGKNVDPLRHYLERGSTAGHEPGEVGADAVKIIAFYLPQYHPTSDNNAAWGKGLAERTQVSRAQRHYGGHERPFLRTELGFPELGAPDVLADQAKLARSYGLSGFCFYHRFDGERVLHRPIDLYLNNQGIDFPFCLCWENGNSTKRWDGLHDELILGQRHTPVSDYSFIYSILPALADPRYIRVNGRPLLLIYRADLLSDPARTLDLWRQAALLAGLGELYVAGIRFRTLTARKWGLDALVELPPHHFSAPALSPSKLKALQLVDGFHGDVRDLESGVDALISSPASAQDAPLFPGVMLGWDSTPRLGTAATVFTNSGPATVEYWLVDALERAKQLPSGEPQLVFMNAWNGWAEGACLEPGHVHGRGYLHALKRASAGHRVGRHPLIQLRAFVKAVGKQSGPAVLFVSPDCEGGEAQHLMLRLIEAIRSRGEIGCFMLLQRDGELRGNYEALGPTLVVEDFEREGWSFNDALQFIVKRLIAGGRIKVALCNGVASRDVGEALAAAGMNVQTYVQELPTSMAEHEAKDAMAAVARSSRRIIAVSASMRNRLAGFYKVPAGDIEIVQTGLRSTITYPLSRRELFRRYGVREAKYVVVGCGVIHPRQSPEIFMQVAQRLAADLGDVVFVWTSGDPKDAVARGAALHDAELLGIGGRVFFLGRIPEGSSFIKKAHVLVVTSRKAPYPLALLDAVEAGTPVVCFDEAGGAADLITRGAGEAVSYLDVTAMAASARGLLTDQQKRERAQAAGAKLRNEFTWDGYVERFSNRLVSMTIAPGAVRQGSRLTRQAVADDLCVVIPSYNHARYVEAAVESVLAQSVRPAEIRIIDDGSTDESPELLHEMASERLGIHVTTRGNIGAHATINEALNATSRRFVAILNSDDFYHPLRFEELLPRLRETDGADLLFSRIRFIDGGGRSVRSEWYDEGLKAFNETPLWLALFRRNVFMTTSNLVARRDALKTIGGFRAFRYCHDVHLILRGVLAGQKVRFVDSTLCDYRIHAANTIGENAVRLAIEEAFYMAEFIASGQVDPSPAYRQSLFEALREKGGLGFFMAFIGWRDLLAHQFDYRTSYDDPDFAAIIAAARLRPEPSIAEFIAALDQARAGSGQRAVG
jgi:glycosyltransferase involved in cell wall biosynthesis